MSEHIDRWLEAYLDGELTAAHQQQVEDHLDGCADCRNRLAQARALSSLLREIPPAGSLKPEKQFVAEIGLRLERRRSPASSPARALYLGWLLMPLFLFIALSFIQAQFILIMIIRFIPGLDQALLGQNAIWFSLPVTLPGGLGRLLGLSGIFSLIDWNWLSSLLAIGCIGLLYLGWLASWWARTQANDPYSITSQRSQ